MVALRVCAAIMLLCCASGKNDDREVLREGSCASRALKIYKKVVNVALEMIVYKKLTNCIKYTKTRRERVQNDRICQHLLFFFFF